MSTTRHRLNFDCLLRSNKHGNNKRARLNAVQAKVAAGFVGSMVRGIEKMRARRKDAPGGTEQRRTGKETD